MKLSQKHHLAALVVTTVLSLCCTLDAAVTKTLSRYGKSRVEKENGVEIIVNDTCYNIARIVIPAKKMTSYNIKITASSPDGAKIGAIAYYYDRKTKKLKAVKNIGWNIVLQKNYTDIKLKLDAEDLKKTKLPQNILVYFYRCNRKGQIRIKDAQMVAKNARQDILKKLNTPVCPQVETRVQLDDFFIGPYIYDGCFARYGKTPDEWRRHLDREVKKLRDYGFNAVYMAMAGTRRNSRGETSDKEGFLDVIEILKKHQIKVIPQLHAFYFRPGWSSATRVQKAAAAANFLKKHKDNPSVICWSIKEEIMPKDADKLADYYRLILKDCPNIIFNHQFHNEKSAQIFPKPWPEFSGGIIYGFYWDNYKGGILASPLRALLYSQSRIINQYNSSAKRGANFVMTITGNSYASPSNAWKYCKPGATEKYTPIFRNLAKNGTLGWIKTENPLGYNRWTRYAAPVNCTKALVWISVMEGARGILNWSYAPRNKTRAEERANSYITKATNHKVGETIVMTLWPNPYIPGSDYLIKEYAQAAKELKPFGKIIVKMRKTQLSPVITSDNVLNRAFKYPGMTGWVVVAANLNVGKWPLNNKLFFLPGDKVYIDKYGRLQGYTPYTKARKVDFKLLDAAGKPAVTDLSTGKTISPTDGVYTCNIMPGSGKFLYVGDPSEAKKLMNLKK